MKLGFLAGPARFRPRLAPSVESVPSVCITKNARTTCTGVLSDGDSAYYRLVDPHVKELVVKKSRFIACAAPVTSAEAAMEFLQMVREKDASHNCWAFKTVSATRSSDDGEPSGTAGRPILSAIENTNFVNAVVVVVRYFGGTKLGAGGLVRAYSRAAADCLKDANSILESPSITLRAVVAMTHVGQLYRLQNEAEFTAESSNGLPDGRFELILNLPSDKARHFIEQLSEATRGTSEVTEQ